MPWLLFYELHLNINDVQKNSQLEKGDKVSFEPEEDPKGTKAVKVRKIS